MAKRQNGKGTLRKRGDGRWEGRFNIGVNENGKPKVKYILAKTQAECARKLKAAIEEYEHDKEITKRCTFLTNPNPTLSEWSAIRVIFRLNDAENFCLRPNTPLFKPLLSKR